MKRIHDHRDQSWVARRLTEQSRDEQLWRDIRDARLVKPDTRSRTGYIIFEHICRADSPLYAELSKQYPRASSELKTHQGQGMFTFELPSFVYGHVPTSEELVKPIAEALAQRMK